MMELRKAFQLSVCLMLILVEARNSKSREHQGPPHIIFIVADDLGWDDVSLHGSSQILTPNIDRLAQEGVTLTNYYVSPICTPTRSAIMTGRHPIHTGMQHDTIAADEPWGLGLDEKTIAQHLKSLGYSTHAVGKWHLGYYAEEYIPTKRGFDSFFGYYNGRGDYFTHEDNKAGCAGYDLHKNGEVYWSAFGQYSTEIFTREAQQIIMDHNASQPLFLYLAHQAVHAGVYGAHLLEAPYKYYQRFPHIKSEGRRKYAAMVAGLDDSVGNISKTLRDTGLYDNSIIVFTTDNGGPTNGYDGNHASNWPLRGCKHTLWEGGVRGTAFVNSPLIERPRRFSDRLMHVCDWLPTLYGAAGGDPKDLVNLDGYDQWDALSMNANSPRIEVLHNIEPIFNYSAIRIGDYKLHYGAFSSRFSGWYPPEGENWNETERVPNAFVVNCPPKPENASTNCDYENNEPCLYNIREDPCEYNNIAEWNQAVVQIMTLRLEQLRQSAVDPRNQPGDPRSNPKEHGNAWVPWVEL
ncbi:arylsulfatase I-like [Lytechinus variegatus]|uniref:arylsulfatase I-like n=1 Tax=Lytechinus variegatus TaxID=7654 RepID=UPI001BB2467F|nr:arylsulfatase I-like [Lytechinus variegatus]XP_041472979.1 arylsulfatase I-like [Lytechinus variegatus]